EERVPAPPVGVFGRLEQEAVAFADQLHERRQRRLEIGEHITPHRHDGVLASHRHELVARRLDRRPRVGCRGHRWRVDVRATSRSLRPCLNADMVESGRTPVPPRAARRPVRLEAHGDVRVDDWFWLRERDDADVQAYLEAENAYTDAITADDAPRREALFEE